MKRTLCAIVFLVFGAASLSAQEISGAEEPGFIKARETWLEGDDLRALQSLAELARSGNIAAKILLSAIADTPHLSEHVSATLTRKEKIELFREPKGLSGKDWLSSASADSELADALWVIQSSATDQPDFEKIVPTLIAYGEITPVFEYLHKMWEFGRDEYAAKVLLEHDAVFGAAGRDFLGFILYSMARSGKPVPVPSSIDTPE